MLKSIVFNYREVTQGIKLRDYMTERMLADKDFLIFYNGVLEPLNGIMFNDIFEYSDDHELKFNARRGGFTDEIVIVFSN